jgi:hypothetical protein
LTFIIANICTKAAPATIYYKCGYKTDGVEKIYKCINYLNGANYINPIYNYSIINNKVNKWCDDYIIIGTGTN